MKLKILLGTYVLGLHVAIGLMAFRPDLAPRALTKAGIYRVYPEIQRAFEGHKNLEPRQPKGAVVFLGDSITRGLVTDNIAPVAVNYGISGLNSTQLLEFSESYHTLRTARAVSLAIGVNDIKMGQTDHLAVHVPKILARIPKATPVVVTTVFPAPALPQEEIDKANAALAAACNARENCVLLASAEAFASAGTKAFLADGTHLSQTGYRHLEAKLAEVVAGILQENTPRAATRL